MKEYGYDCIDGRMIPQMVVSEDYILVGEHYGTIHLESGSLIINGKLNGMLDVQSNTKVVVNGQQCGKVIVESGASVTVYGEMSGLTRLAVDSELIVEEDAKFTGLLANEGNVIMKGVFRGEQKGNGEMIFAEKKLINN